MHKPSLKSLMRSATLAAGALASLLLLHCSEKGTFNPAGPEVRLVLFQDLAATPNRVTAGGSPSIISGRVVDQEEHPYAAEPITFWAAKGSIFAADSITTDSGYFAAEYRSPNVATTDTLIITVRGEEAGLLISVVGVSAQLTLELGRTSVLANGMDTTFVMATLIGSEGPITRVPVRFETSAGEFNGQSVTYANTDNGGMASVTLTAPSSRSGIPATVTATVSEQMVSMGFNDRVRSLGMVKDIPKTDEADAEANKTITFRGVSIAVEADPLLLPADGRATAKVRALVKEETHQAVSQATVSFSAELGSIPVTAVTSNAGMAEVALTAGRTAGAVDHIVAHYGPALADTILITYAEAVSNIGLVASPASVLADGVARTTITATVVGGTGVPSPDIEIRFSADAGIISPASAITGADGKAIATLRAPSSESDVPILVKAEVVTGEGEAAVIAPSGRQLNPVGAKVTGRDATPRGLRATTPVILDTRLDSIVVVARGVKLQISVDPDSIIARPASSSSVVAQVYETVTGNPVVGDTVRFAATLGSIVSMGILDQQGRTEVTYMAGLQVGHGTVLARFGAAHRDSATVELLPTIGNMVIGADRVTLLAGALDTARVAVLVTDALGGAASSIPVIYNIDFDPGARQIITDRNGLARFDVVSPALERDTTAVITITAGELQQVFHLGIKAITRIVTSSPDSASAGSDNPVSITFRAFESGNRRPVTGDTVWFSALEGVVQPYAVLDRNGICRADFLAGPDPVTAYIVGQLGTLTVDSVRVQLVEPIAQLSLSSARPSVLENGLDTTQIVARVANVLDQPTPRVWVRFETDAGQISPSEALTDENGRAYATFVAVAGSADSNAVITAEATHLERNEAGGDIQPGRKVDQVGTLTSSPIRATLAHGKPVTGALRDGVLPALKAVEPISHLVPVIRPADADQVSDTLGLLMRGVSLDLRLEPRQVRANGSAKSGVNVQLTETTTGSPIANVNVRFGATLGVIAAEGTTSNDGTITDSLTTGIVPGWSLVRASYGNVISTIDSVRFAADPARMDITLSVDPAEGPADGQSDIALSSTVTDVGGAAMENLGVRYTLEGGKSVLVDPNEYREVKRWQNTFRIEDAASATGLRLRLHLRGVDARSTEIYLNRQALDNIQLPMDRLWAESIIDLPVNLINNGVNRIEIIAGRDQDITDRFSVAGVRLELLASHVIADAVTDANGATSAHYTSDRVEGVYVIRAALLDDTSRYTEESVVLKPQDPAIVLVSSSTDTVLASGNDDADVVVLVTDANGNPVTEGYQVSLATDALGTIDPVNASTLGDGTVGARFFAPASEQNDTTDLVVTCNGVEGRWPILLQGVTMVLTSEDNQMLADGRSIMAVQARLKTADGDPVRDRRVNFETTLGTITQSEKSDADGVAIVTLTAPDSAGTADITATFGPELTRQIQVTFVPVVQDISVTADPASIRGNGKDKTDCEIEVHDGLGRGAPGLKIDLSADKGRLSTTRVTTDQDGRASVQLSGFATIADDTIMVIAKMLDYDLADTLAVIVRGVSIVLSADPDSIIARQESSSQVSARVFETTSGNPVTRDTVRFAATRGIITGLAPLSDEGIASVVFHGEDRTGSAEITARYTDIHRDTTIIELLPTVAGLTVTSGQNSVLAGGIESAELTAMVTDALGDPAPDVTVSYEDDWHAGAVHYTTTGDNGRATFAVASPPAEADSAVNVTVSAGQLQQDIRIAVRGITRHVFASPDSLSAGGGDVSITLNAIETGSHRPIVSDTVWFAASDGTIQPYAILDRNGEATTTLTVGDTPGETWVVGQLGDLAWDSVRVVLVEPVATITLTSGRGSLLASGEDTTVVTARVTNELGQAVPGAKISFATGDGGVNPEATTTDNDGVATTLFTGAADAADRQAIITVSAQGPGHDAGENGRSLRWVGGPIRLQMMDAVSSIQQREGGVNRLTGRLAKPARGKAPRRDQGGASDSVAVELRGVTLALHANPREIRADGRSKSGLDVQLNETTSGEAIADADIRFGASLGAVSSSGTTGPDGRLTDSLTAGIKPGASVIRAYFGNLLTAIDTVQFTYDPARLKISLTIAPEEAAVDSGGLVTLQSRVLNNFGGAVPGVAVDFFVDGPMTALVDSAEYRQVTRWENSFRVEDPDAVTSLLLQLQIRGVESDETKIYINRNAVDVTLPNGTLWQESLLELPANGLNRGSNRIEIIAGAVGGVSDRFSVAGIRLGVVGSHFIEEMLTDNDGYAQSSIAPDRTAGQMDLKAALADNPDRSARGSLSIFAGPPQMVRVSTGTDTLLSNGEEETQVLAMAVDRYGNPAGDGFTVNFSVDSSGTIDPASTKTQGDGTASALLTAPVSATNENATVTAQCNGASQTWPILLRGVTLNLAADDDRLLADGHSTTTLRARLASADGAAITDRTVTFGTSRGSVAQSATTDASGVATAILTAASSPDTAIVTAAFGPHVADTTSVLFQSLVANLGVTSDPQDILGDGTSRATLTITVLNGVEDPASGVRVNLSANAGRLSRGQVTTNAEGQATATLTGFASVGDDSIRVVAATTDGAQKDTLYVHILGVTVNLSTATDSLPANGRSTTQVTAHVVETTSGNPVAGVRVTFSASSGSIAGAATLDQDGVAEVTYTSGSSPGSANLRLRFGPSLSAQTAVVLVDPVAALALSVSPTAILANGLSTASVVAKVTDPWGDPAPDELVTLDFSGPGTVTPQLGYTDDSGILRATAIGNASTADGLLIVTAEAHGGALTETDTLRLRGVTIAASALPIVIPGDGETKSVITVKVRETTSGRAVQSGTVNFATTAGTIPAEGSLDATGRASVDLRSENHPAIATVVAAYGDELTDTVSVAFAGRFSYLDARGGRTTLLADGEDTTAIAVTLTDTLGNAVSGVWVDFAALGAGGTLSADSALTDQSGRAEIVYTSAPLNSDGGAQVRASAGALADTVTIGLKGITVSLTVEPDSIPANGRSTAAVTARVRRTASGSAITEREVRFGIDHGLIQATGTLDNQGQVRVNLTADDSAGIAIVTASFGNSLSASANVVYIAPEGSVDITAERNNLLGDGLSHIQVSALVRDALGNAASGVAVNFSAPNGGRLSAARVTTDINGMAVATFTGFATRTDSTLSVQAVTDGGAADAVSIDLLGITADLTANPNQVPANGRATSAVTLHAYETTAHNPVTGATVTFSADRGSIGQTATTGDDGHAGVIFTAPTSAGNALVNAVIGDTLKSSLTIVCATSQPVRAALSISPREIFISGVGETETATLRADVTDADNQRVPDGTSITFTIAADIGVRFAGGADTVVATTEDGTATVMVVSGNQAGSVKFKALYGNTLLALGGELTVKGGPPVHIRVRPDVNTVYHPNGGLSALPVSATVSDQFGNPVPDSTSVRFTLKPDTIAQISGTGYTEGGVVLTPVQPIDYPTGIWLTYDDSRAGDEVWVYAAAGGGAAIDSARVVLPGAIAGGAPASMALSIGSAVLPADGQRTTDVTVELFDSGGNHVADLTEVTFAANLGSIQRTKNTAGGLVTNTYRAGRVAAVDTITVTADTVSAFVTIRLTAGNAASITVTAADATIRAGGVQATTISATVVDQYGNRVPAGTQVTFTTELGSITGSAETEDNGVATVRLVSGDEVGISLVTARSGVAAGQTSVQITSGAADGIVLKSINRNSIGVRGSGSPETATLTFEVRDEWGIPVDSLHRALVSFTLDGPDKVINPAQSSADSVAFLEPASDSTDNNGRVAVNLTSGYFAGTVQVTASVSGNITGQAIAVAINGGPPDLNHLSLIVQRCVLTGIYGTEVDSTRLTAVVGDRYANPTVPGTVVYFTATGGVVAASASTDSLGVCNTILRTSNPWPVGGVDTLTAQTVDWNDQEITTPNYVLVTGPTIVTFDTASGWAIPFGAYRDFTITVADTFDHPLTAGTSVFIQAEAVDNQGNAVEGVRLDGDATDQAYVIGECDPVKDFNVRLFNFVTGLDGAFITLKVTVQSRNGNVQVETAGIASGQFISTALSRVILNPDEIVADGADLCDVQITLYDTLAVAVPNVPPDYVTVSIGAGNPIITPPQDPSDQDGRMSAGIVGRALGQGNVQVRVQGALLAEQPTLRFIPGPPAAMTVVVLDRRLTVGGDTATVVVNVTDASGNSVADGTAVIFEADDGGFAPAATTTSGGGASTLFSSGITSGDATFTVTASGQGAEVTQDVGVTYLPGAPTTIVFDADNYSIEVGTSVDVTITVKDQFGNIVAQNTRMDVSVSPSGRGSVAPSSIRTDDKGVGTVQYTAGTTAGQTARLVATDPIGGATDSSAAFVFKAGAARNVNLTANPNNTTVGTAIDLNAAVTDAYGNDVTNGTVVTFTRDPAVGTLNPSAAGTSGGAVSSRLTNVTTKGSVTVTATAGQVSGLASITFAPDVLATIEVSAAPAEIDSGQTSTITATAKDRFGNAIPGITLNFELTDDLGGTVTLYKASLRTNGSGQAANFIIAGNQSGWAEVRVYDVTDTIEETVAVRVK